MRFCRSAFAIGIGFWLSRPTPAERYQRGLVAYESGDLAALRSEAAFSLRHEVTKRTPPCLKGLIQKQRGRLREAIELFGTATNNPATRGTAFTHAGESFYRMRRFDDARELSSKPCRSIRKNVDAQRWLASTYYDLGLMTAALSTLRTLAELAPDDARPHRLAGLILKDFENYDEAVTAYRESLRRDPQQPELIRYEPNSLNR